MRKGVSYSGTGATFDSSIEVILCYWAHHRPTHEKALMGLLFFHKYVKPDLEKLLRSRYATSDKKSSLTKISSTVLFTSE